MENNLYSYFDSTITQVDALQKFLLGIRKDMTVGEMVKHLNECDPIALRTFPDKCLRNVNDMTPTERFYAGEIHTLMTIVRSFADFIEPLTNIESDAWIVLKFHKLKAILFYHPLPLVEEWVYVGNKTDIHPTGKFTTFYAKFIENNPAPMKLSDWN